MSGPVPGAAAGLGSDSGRAVGHAEDQQDFLAELVDGVGRALPGAEESGALEVTRRRSLGDRLAGRPGAIERVRLAGPGEVLTLAPGRVRGAWSADAERVSGGVTIARRTLPLGEWLTAFAGRVAAIAAGTSGDAASASMALRQLGIRIGGADVRVGEATLTPDLQALPGLLAGRLPAAALATVGRITALLLETLPRVSGRGEAEVTVLRAATVYLPDTLQSYLALPAEWAASHELPGHGGGGHGVDGQGVVGNGTPADELGRQLTLLERSVTEVRDAAIADDAAALLTNGRFLEARFTPPRLDLR